MSDEFGGNDTVATVVNGHTFTIDPRYILKDARILGKGSFGVVTTAYDSIRKIDIAIKRTRPYANDEWDARHTLREIRLLKLLGPHPNVVSLYELSLFLPKTELYMMMELMDCDLHRVIQSKQPLTEKHHKCFVKQVLEAVKAMHAVGVFHRDLKPGNILVSKDCQIRITDFGLARYIHDSTRHGENDLNPMTEYVVTRWYRCPELLLSPQRPYTEAIDLWSVGCILAELLKRKPLFPGKSHANQVQLVFEVMGYDPDTTDLGFPLTEEATTFLNKRCRFPRQSFRKLLPEASVEALSLLENLLTLNPAHRPSAAVALQHPFMHSAEVFYDYDVPENNPEHVVVNLTPPPAHYFDFEHEKYTLDQLKGLIHDEVRVAASHRYRTAPPGSVPSGRTVAGVVSSSYPQHPATSAPGSASAAASGHSPALDRVSASSAGAESGGPMSQLATQVRNNVRVSGTSTSLQSNINSVSNSSGNSNRAGNVQEARAQLAAYLQPQQQGSAAGGASLLAAVRQSGGNSARASAPKTPTPQKMDMILQKDQALRQRFQQQQQDDDEDEERQRKDHIASNSYNHSNYAQYQTTSQAAYGRRATQPRPSAGIADPTGGKTRNGGFPALAGARAGAAAAAARGSAGSNAANNPYMRSQSSGQMKDPRAGGAGGANVSSAAAAELLFGDHENYAGGGAAGGGNRPSVAMQHAGSNVVYGGGYHAAGYHH